MIGTTGELVSTAQRMLTTIERDNRLAQAILDREPWTAEIRAFDRINITKTYLVTQAWREVGRQVLAVHPTIVDEVRLATSDSISTDILRVLPYLNPMVIFPDPPVFDSWVKMTGVQSYTAAANMHSDMGQRPDRDEAAQRLLGFIAYSQDHDMQGGTIDIGNTHDPDMPAFGVMFLFEILDSHDRVIDHEINTVSIPFGVTATMREVVDDLITRFHWNAMGLSSNRKARRWMADVMNTIVGTLFYLCSTTLEADPIPRRQVRRISGSTRKPISLYRVGWTTGAALTRLRRQVTDTEPSTHRPTFTQDPQHRRGHFRLQPYGPGRTQRKLIFIAPYWTHRERLDQVGVNTMHTVPPIDPPREAIDSVIKMSNQMED